jgi:TonB-dependent starch-binding outer membrane protein SusC
VVSRTTVGSSIGDFYGYVSDGVYKNEADLNASAKLQGTGLVAQVGDTKYVDINHIGVVDSRDETDLGSPLPKFTYGINNSFTYKSFDLTVFFTGSYGNKILNYNEVLYEDPNAETTGVFEGLSDYARVATGTNGPYVTNPNTIIPGFRSVGDPDQNIISSRFIQSGSYLRLRNLAFGYTFNKSLVQAIHLKSLRVYANVANLLTITKYTGYDPEIGANVPNQSGYGSNALTEGIDWGRYPTPRIYTLGLVVGL